MKWAFEDCLRKAKNCLKRKAKKWTEKKMCKKSQEEERKAESEKKTENVSAAEAAAAETDDDDDEEVLMKDCTPGSDRSVLTFNASSLIAANKSSNDLARV